MLVNFGEQIPPKVEIIGILNFRSCWAIYFAFSIKCHLRTPLKRVV